MKKILFKHKSFLGVFCFFISAVLNNFLVSPPKYKTPEVLIPYTALTVLGSISFSFLVFVPALIVEIIVKDLSKDCRDKMLRIENSCTILFEKYEKLDKMLGNFFISFFTITQFTLVLMAFLRNGFKIQYIER